MTDYTATKNLFEQLNLDPIIKEMEIIVQDADHEIIFTFNSDGKIEYFQIQEIYKEDDDE